MSNDLTDWKVKLGWDTTEVDKGMRDLERKFKKLDLKYKVGVGGSTGQRAGSGQIGGVARKQQSVTKGDRFNPLSTSLTRLNENQRAAGTKTISNAIVNAERGINQLGGRSDADAVTRTRMLKAEVERLRSAQARLNKVTYSNSTTYRTLKADVANATAKIKNLNAEVKSGTPALNRQNEVLNAVTRSFKNMGIAAISAYAVFRTGGLVLGEATKIDSLRASLLAASGSAEQAGKDFNWVRSQAVRLGRDLQTSIEGYQQIGTAARAANLTVEQSRMIFVGASEAATAFGLSASDNAGVMRAFTQIMSKGSVQAEEIRGQLGDRLPGAYNIAARAMGMTTDEFGRQLKAGRVNSKEFILKFIPALKKYANESGAVVAGMNNIRAAQNRAKIALTDFSTALLDGGLKNIMVDVFGIAEDLLRIAQPMGQAIIWALEPVAAMVSGITDGFKEIIGFWSALTGITQSDDPDANKTKSISDRLDLLGGGVWDMFMGSLQGFSQERNKFGTGIFEGFSAASAARSKAVEKTINLNIDATGLGAEELADVIEAKVSETLTGGLTDD